MVDLGDESFDQKTCFYPHYITHPILLFSLVEIKHSFLTDRLESEGCESEVVFATLVAWVCSITLSIHYSWVWAHGMTNMYF